MSETHGIFLQTTPHTIAAGAICYIKLGRGGELAADCFAGGCIGLGFEDVPHDLCARGDWNGVRQHFLSAGKTSSKAAGHTRELRTFYEAGPETLWITFVDGRLWWAFAEASISWDAARRLPRQRRTIGPWRSCDASGAPLLARSLSARLTSVGYYRGTICEVREKEYLLNRLNGREEPIIAEAAQLRGALHDLAQRLIATLHPRDFEIMVDLIFNASGWRRVSILGETEADTDLLLEQIATGERAFVQVKSKATPASLDDYIARFKERGDCGRMFFVCHTPSRALAKRAETESDIDLWFSETLAEKALRAGLFDWLVERVR